MSDIAIAARSLGKTYASGVAALHGLSLAIPRGEIFGFLGPNGAGKSTTVRLLNGVLDASTGEAWLAGQPVTGAGPTIRGACGVLTETAHAYEHLTARQNLAFFGALHGLDRATVAARTAELLAQLDLTAAADRAVGTFSTGMRRRLTLAIALLHRPELLFLDEPTAGLDPEAARQVTTLIQRLAREDGVTVFLCTHQLEVFEKICTSYGFIHGGRMIASGSFPALVARMPHWRRLEVRGEGIPAELGFSPTGDGTWGHPITDDAEAGRLLGAIIAAGGTVFEARHRHWTLPDLYFAFQERARAETPPPPTDQTSSLLGATDTPATTPGEAPPTQPTAQGDPTRPVAPAPASVQTVAVHPAGPPETGATAVTPTPAGPETTAVAQPSPTAAGAGARRTAARAAPSWWQVLRAIVGKDLREVVTRPKIWIPMVLMPFILTVVMPSIVLYASAREKAPKTEGLEHLLAHAATQYLFSSPKQQALHVMLNYLFPAIFLMIPTMVSSLLAANSFVGEKEQHTLETLLYTPVSLTRLFWAKILGAFVPAYLITIGSFVAISLVINLGAAEYCRDLGFPNLRWVTMLGLLIPPLIVLALCFTVYLSAKASTFQEAAQPAGFLVVPILGILFSQFAGWFTLDIPQIIGLALVVTVVDVILVQLAARRFSYEELLR